jgi:hypothetical protein
LGEDQVDSVTEEATEVALVVALALVREGAIWSDKSDWISPH